MKYAFFLSYTYCTTICMCYSEKPRRWEQMFFAPLLLKEPLYLGVQLAVPKMS